MANRIQCLWKTALLVPALWRIFDALSIHSKWLLFWYSSVHDSVFFFAISHYFQNRNWKNSESKKVAVVQRYPALIGCCSKGISKSFGLGNEVDCLSLKLVQKLLKPCLWRHQQINPPKINIKMHIYRHPESLNFIKNRRSLHQRKMNFAFRCTSCNIQKVFFLQQTSPKKRPQHVRKMKTKLHWPTFVVLALIVSLFFRAVWFHFKTAFYVVVFGVIVLCCFGSLAGYNSSSSSLRDWFVFFRVYFIEAFSVSFTLKASSWARSESEMEEDNSETTCLKGSGVVWLLFNDSYQLFSL